MRRRPSSSLHVFVAVVLAIGCDDGSAADAGRPEAWRDAGSVDAGGLARERIMYVSVGDASRIAVVALADDGTMSARTAMDLALPANPGPLAYARRARRLYVGFDDGFGTIELDAAGAMTLLGRTQRTGVPTYLAVARDDAVLVSAYFGEDLVRSHDVSGAPPHTERSSVPTSDEPHCARVGPTGTRVYVPHRNGETTRWFDLLSDGSLAYVGELAAEAGAGPRHVDYTPDGRFAYVVNEQGDSVSAHRVMSDGSLERFQTISTLPAGANGASNSGADVHVTPDGRFVYASNRGHDSLAMFAVQSDGTLSSLGNVPTETRPREFDVSPDGRFVVAAGQDSGALQSYRVESDGTLTSVDRLPVGPNLLWVVID
ncbi:MAG: lactonase family protein [Sandaracinaceae bacterium]